MQLGGRFACSRAGAVQEIIISFGEGQGPSLTDALVVFYLLFTECSNLPFQVNFMENFQGGRVGESKILDTVG